MISRSLSEAEREEMQRGVQWHTNLEKMFHMTIFTKHIKIIAQQNQKEFVVVVRFSWHCRPARALALVSGPIPNDPSPELPERKPPPKREREEPTPSLSLNLNLKRTPSPKEREAIEEEETEVEKRKPKPKKTSSRQRGRGSKKRMRIGRSKRFS